MAETRLRRGKVVAIPEQWQGETLHPQTKRRRMSKQSARVRRSVCRRPLKDGTFPTNDYREKRFAMIDESA